MTSQSLAAENKIIVLYNAYKVPRVTEYQFSPNDINTSPRDKDMRILNIKIKMMT